MYKMLIVDDEHATIEGIQSAINWNMMDIQICGSASDGLDALRIIDEMKPDILLCDIRMPRMDGISLGNQLRRYYPEIKIIFISGYSDKELLKSAIRLNVIDYVFKPFEITELVQAVENAKMACAKKIIPSDTVSSGDLAIRLIKNDNINISLTDCAELDPVKPIVTIIIYFNTNPLVENNFESLATNQSFGGLRDYFITVFNHQMVMSRVDSGCILHANVGLNFFSDSNLQDQLNGIFRIVNGFANCMVVGISDPVKLATNLKDSYLQAKQAVNTAFLCGYSRIIYYRSVSKMPFTPFKDVENVLYAAVDSNNIATAIDYFEKYVDYMRTCRPEDIPAIKDELIGIAFHLNQKLHKRDMVQQGYFTDSMNFALDILDIKKKILQIMQQIQAEINNLNQKGRIIFDVEKYILQNYDKDLSIGTIAKNTYLTPSYLCHLYKKVTGKTINDFILEVKMNKSMMMLKESNMKISEIANKLGYANQNYFTKLFTKHFGESPSAIRNRQF